MLLATQPETSDSSGGSPEGSPQAPVPRAPHALDAVLETTAQTRVSDPVLLDRFLAAREAVPAVAFWIAQHGLAGQVTTSEQALRQLNRDIAAIDVQISRQVNAILHHPRFQKLEASWRGLQYLVDHVEDGALVKVRVFNVGWDALARDLDRAIEFDQSQLFHKVYSEEFGISGGEPYSVLLGDYEIRPTTDLQALAQISEVAAAAFAPFIAAAHPSLLGLDSFAELQRAVNLEAVFEQPDFLKWQMLRKKEDSRFVGLVLPRVLMRVPYADNGSRVDSFRFHEETAAPDLAGYLWGNAVYAFGAVLLRAFTESGWLADIRGVRQDRDEAGLLSDLPTHWFGTDRAGLAGRSATEVPISEFMESELSELGFMPLCHCHDTECAAFYANSSIQKPRQYEEALATANARISAMLHYMLCVSRIAHYLKVLGREKIGTFADAGDCEHFLNDWLSRYVTHDDDATPETKARFPLREAEAQVREQPGRPGSYSCVILLQPHYQLDDIVSAIRLTTELAAVRA